MAQNFEPFHVPQQNRKNKLRVTTQTNQEQQNPPTPLFSRQAPMNPSQSSSFSSLQTLKDMNYQPLTSQGLSLCLSFQLDNQRYNAVSVSGDYTKQNGEMRSSVVPLGPFTGYASILTSSRFLKPAQQILDEICGVINCANANFPLDGLGESEITRESIAFLSGGVEHQWKNSKLILMLDEVYILDSSSFIFFICLAGFARDLRLMNRNIKNKIQIHKYRENNLLVKTLSAFFHNLFLQDIWRTPFVCYSV
jgi:hypothetical protein